jgi:hypothetical protein
MKPLKWHFYDSQNQPITAEAESLIEAQLKAEAAASQPFENLTFNYCERFPDEEESAESDAEGQPYATSDN